MTSPYIRLWEVDALRALAIAMMVTYHLAYDVNLLAADTSRRFLHDPG